MNNRIAFLFDNSQPTGGAMGRKRENKQQLGTYLPVELIEELRNFSEQTGVPMARIIESALRQYLQRSYYQNESDDDNRDGRA